MVKIELSKKTIIYFIVIIWVIFSVFYIMFDIWTDFKEKENILAYEQGKIDTLNAVIKEAKTCNEITISNEQDQISIISVDCLEFNEPNEQLDFDI
ncbi:MAG: hypothetical protein ACOC3X_00825 [Nanoarchaeota archaeon]